ncbi:MBL fold metallo-hydrolase [Bacillus sp. Marseille-P3661]|uniref:MBL fold metallo-hydrolase n=1 Tax=Bacillus sp. Marseille-P3661 TaxID=1936234 RepID=UPI000C862CC8|nr:MBL fold metallo-hydrolase [Bacillus sp. Marseille-P3661]
MQIIRNVFQVCGSPFGTNTNSYAVKGEDSIVLIDGGLDEAQLEIVDENLKYWGLSDYPISHMLITHAHFDHSGNAHIFKKRGAQIVAGPGDAEAIETGDERTLSYAFRGKKFNPCKVDVTVKDGDIINAAGLNFEVIHTPGHSGGSVVYKLEVDGKMVLFMGDFLVIGPDCQSVEFGWNGSPDYDQKAYYESVVKIKDYPADILLTGHLQPCLRDGYAVLQDSYKEAILKLK